MKLCKHIKTIYQNEIKRGNSIVYLTKWGDCLMVYLKNKMENYSSPSDVIFHIETDPHYLHTQEYFCSKCHCSVCSPVEKAQYGWCKRDKFTVYSDDAIATPETIEIKDEVWKVMNRAIVPKMMGFEDKY